MLVKLNTGQALHMPDSMARDYIARGLAVDGSGSKAEPAALNKAEPALQNKAEDDVSQAKRRGRPPVRRD